MLLHFGNLESRCGFSYDGLPLCWRVLGQEWQNMDGNEVVIGEV